MLLENYIKAYIKEHNYNNKNILNVFDFDLTLYKDNQWLENQVKEVKNSMKNESCITILCTARNIQLEDETMSLLYSKGLIFDKCYFKKTSRKEPAEIYKAKVFRKILGKNKNITQVNFWDDLSANIKAAGDIVKVNGITYNGYLIQSL